jgi:glycine/D-amino acid oxidase-like deaminating enzyme
MSTGYDIAIVGAGIVGAACAAQCARCGLKVLVLEQGNLAGGTTAAAMGHVVVMDDSEAQFALTAYGRRLWHGLADCLPSDVEYDPCGTLWVAADEEEMAAVRPKERFYRTRGISAEVLDAASLAKAEPNLRPALLGGLLVPDDLVVYPPCATRFLLDQARSSGADVRIGVKVQSLRSDGSLILADGARIAAGQCVNATGCWSPELTAGLPVRKRKGHLAITDRYPGHVRHQLVELGYLKSAHTAAGESVAFNIQPRKTGQLLIGSSRQFDADHGEVEPELLGKMLRRAIHYMPSLANLSVIRAWTGHRAATPDKLPLIGPSLLSDRIWLATGHEGLGITTSLATGQLLADLILGRATEISAAPYLPARLAQGVPQHA